MRASTFVMPADSSIGDQSSGGGLTLLSAADLLLQERSHLRSSSLKTGIKSIDHQFRDLFSGGKVIALGQSQDDETSSLTPHLIVSVLLGTAVAISSIRPHIFILGPPTTTVISSVHNLLYNELKTLPLTSGQSAESAAFDLLDKVQILQYLDLPGLAESLSEVSQRLYENGQTFTTADDGSGLNAAGNGATSGSVLLVQGLSAILSTVQRRSATVQTCAILSSLLRTVKHLSKIHNDLIVLVEIEVAMEGDILRERDDTEASTLDSAFSSATGATIRVVPETRVGSVIERGMDVIVCVHDGFAKMSADAKGKSRDGSHQAKTRIVEVVKERTGGRFGEWCIWVQ